MSFVVDIIFLKLLKAFNVMNYYITLTKLEMLVIGDMLLFWICDFLYGEKICVTIADTVSNYKMLLVVFIPFLCWVLFCIDL